MKHNKRILLLILSLTLVFSILFTIVASARNVSGASVGDDEIERGDAWEMLNSKVYDAEDLINAVGDDFTDNYRAALKRYQSHAKSLLDSTTSTTAELTAMTDDMNYLIDEQKNPANHARFGYYTIAFTNNGGWSDPIHLYNWSDDGGEISAWPGEAMRGGYTNEYGQKQYYAFVPMDVPNIVISSNQLEATSPDAVVPCVCVQTVDIFVTGNTGYYLTGEKDGAKYKVATWELKAPTYKTFDLTEPIPTEPVTEQPTVAPTVAPTVNPTEAPTEKPTVSEQDYELGAVLVSMSSGTPDGLLDGFEIEECRLITPGSTSMAVYHVRFKEKTKEIVWRAIEVLRQSPRVKIAEPNYYGSFEVIDDPTEAPTEKPTVSEQEYELGAVLVSMSSGTPDGLLDGFEIEECRLITPGSTSMAVYHVRFKEKTKEIVWRAIEVLRQSPRVKIAEPNYYGSFEVIDDPDPIWTHLIGDADDDGEVTVLDATCIQRVLADFDKDKRAKAERYASITGTSLSILDATAIQRFLAGFLNKYGIGGHFS